MQQHFSELKEIIQYEIFKIYFNQILKEISEPRMRDHYIKKLIHLEVKITTQIQSLRVSYS